MFKQRPELFKPLLESPEELEVRALTELWVQITFMKKAAKIARSSTNNIVATEAHLVLRRLTKRLTNEIHKKAEKMPLYRLAFEELGLKGASLAYIISHDSLVLKTLARDRLVLRYQLLQRPWRRRPLRSHLLIMLANTAIINRHQKYRGIYEHYRRKNKGHWPAVLRVAKRLLIDLHRLAQKAGPPA